MADFNVNIYDEVFLLEVEYEVITPLHLSVSDLIAAAENVAMFADELDANISIFDAISVAENIAMFADALDCNVSVTEAIAVAESVALFGLANLITKSKNAVMITGLGGDWSWLDTYPGNENGLLVVKILFSAEGANELVVRDGSLTGPIIAKFVTAAAETEWSDFPKTRLSPCVALADCTITSNSFFSITFDH